MSRTNPIKGKDERSIRQAIQRLSHVTLGLDSEPTFAELTLTGLTASRLLASDADKGLVSSDLINWIDGTSNQVTVTDDSDGTVTLSTPQDIHTGAVPTFAGLTSTGIVQATGFAKTGWSNTPDVTLSFDNASKVFTVTDGGSAHYYINGVKYTLGGNKTVDLDDIGIAEGLWFIYFSGATLTASQTPWVISDDDKAFVAIVYWDNTNNKEILTGYELHNYIMDSATHSRLHDGGGSAWEQGLQVSDAGSETLNITGGEFHDEDIEVPITDGNGGGLFEQVLTPAELPIYYRDGASNWRKYETTDKANATDIGYVDGSNDLHYNKLNGTWVSTAVAVGKYVAYFIIATNDQTEPVAAIMGQNVDNTLADAKASNIFSQLSLTGVPFQEVIILARVLVKMTGSGVYYTIEEITDLRILNVAGNVTSPLVTDHGAMVGLLDDDHTQYLLADGTRALAGAWDMGNQALINVNIDSGVITGITDLAVADGGTGASNAGDARTNLGLVIGTDVLAQQTIGIADNNLVEVDDADAADNDYAKFTANGLEGRSYAEVLSDLSGQASAAFDLNGQDLTNGGVIFLTEQAAAEGDIAGKGQWWVKNDTPCRPYFTGDTGVDICLDNRFVDRGDPASSDFEVGDLTTDDTWRDLDLSSIVESNAVVVLLYLKVQDNDATGSYIFFRKNGNSNPHAISGVRVQTAGIGNDNTCTVACDSSQVIEYLAANVTWTTIRITVLGWWLG